MSSPESIKTSQISEDFSTDCNLQKARFFFLKDIQTFNTVDCAQQDFEKKPRHLIPISDRVLKSLLSSHRQPQFLSNFAVLALIGDFSAFMATFKENTRNQFQILAGQMTFCFPSDRVTPFIEIVSHQDKFCFPLSY